MRKQVRFIAMALLTSLSLSACSANDSKMAENNFGTSAYAPQATAAPAPYPAEAVYNKELADGEIFYDSVMREESPSYTGKITNEIPASERKVILNGFIDMQTEDYADASARLRSLTLGAGGFIESSHSYVRFSDNERDYMSGSFTLRVPYEQYEDTKADIEAIGQVVSTSDSSTDATDEFYDAESRVKSLRAQETSVLGMIEKAKEIEDLLLLEQRLSEIRTEIELFQTRMNTIDRQASFSTIHVELTEVRVYEPIRIAPKTTWEKIQNSFIGSINDVLAFFEGLVIALAYAILPLLLLAVLCLLAWCILRRVKRKNARKRAEHIATAESPTAEGKDTK